MVVAVKYAWDQFPNVVVYTVAALVVSMPFGVYLSSHRDRKRGWRVGHRGRDEMFYEEVVNGRWERIWLDGEMLCGKAHHVIYFPSNKQWETFPVWTRGRQAEIFARIKHEFASPGYEYQETEPSNTGHSEKPSF
jgi:hypothetical protein